MTNDLSYTSVMGRSAQILKKALGINYDDFIITPLAFDYEGMMGGVGYTLNEIQCLQQETSVGQTPLLELHNITALARKLAPKGKGGAI